MKKFFYQFLDPFISKSIEVNVNECKTVYDLKQKISFELHVFNHNLLFETEPIEKDLKRNREYTTFKLKFVSRCKDIDFSLPNGKIIRINDCYNKDFPEIIQSFREKNLYYSEDCVKNIHFIVNKQEVPHINYPLLAVPKDQLVYVKMSCNVAILDYGYNRFIFSENEFISDAEKFISKRYEGFLYISILNDQGRKLKPHDKFRKFSTYKAQIIFKLIFKHISTYAESNQHLDFLSTVYDAKKQLAIVYSNEKKLMPENIAIFDSNKIKIEDPRKLLKNIQKLSSPFYFDIDKKKKFYEISTKKLPYQEPVKYIDSQLDEFKNPKNNVKNYNNDFKFNHNNLDFTSPKHYNVNSNYHSQSPDRNITVNDKYKNSYDFPKKHRHSYQPKKEYEVNTGKKNDDIKETGYKHYQKANSPPSKTPNHLTNSTINAIKTDNQTNLYENKKKKKTTYYDTDIKPKKLNKNDDIIGTSNVNSTVSNKVNQNWSPKKTYESKSKYDTSKKIDDDGDDDQSYESTKVHIPFDQQNFASSSSSLNSKRTSNPHQFQPNKAKSSSTTHYTQKSDHNYSNNNYGPIKRIGNDDEIGNSNYNSVKNQRKQKPLFDINSDDDDKLNNRERQSSFTNNYNDYSSTKSNAKNQHKQNSLPSVSDDDNELNNAERQSSFANNYNDYSSTKRNDKNQHKQNSLPDVSDDDNDDDKLNNRERQSSFANNYNDYSSTKSNAKSQHKQNSLPSVSDDDENSKNSDEDFIQSDKIINDDDDDDENSNKNENFKQSIDSIHIEPDNDYDYNDNENDDENDNKNYGSHELKKSSNNTKFSTNFDAQQQYKSNSRKQLNFIVEDEEEEYEFSHDKDNENVPKQRMIKYYYQTNNDGAVNEIELDSEATVLSMKQEIAEKNKISNLNNIKILLSGKELPDDNLLESHNIGDTNLFIYIRSEEDIRLMTAKALQFDSNQVQSFEEEEEAE